MPRRRKHALSLRERRTYSDEKVMQKIETRYVCEPNSGCWLWTARINAGGYGLVYAGGRSQIIASRAMYEIVHRIHLPTVLCVCHRCDTPACVNPHHLFLGTNKDNTRDAAAKGRMNRWNGRRAGSLNHSAKLTEEDVAEIRRIGTSVSARTLGARFGVSKTAILWIRVGKSWSADWKEKRFGKRQAA